MLNNLLLKLYFSCEYPFRRFKVIIKRALRHFERKVLIKKFNTDFSELSFSFSVGSLFLILFKFLFRLVGIHQPIVINCLIFLIFTYLAYRFLLIDYVREYLMLFWMLVLGERFYFQKQFPSPADWGALINFSYEEELEKTPKFSLLNYFFQYFLYFLIFIRLLIISETYLFIIFNFLLT